MEEYHHAALIPNVCSRRLSAAQGPASNTRLYRGRVVGFLFAPARLFCTMTAWALLAGAVGLPQQAWAQWSNAAAGQAVASESMTPPVAVAHGFKLGLEAGGGWARNGFEDSVFNGRGFVGGASAQWDFPVGGVAYTGLAVSLLGSSTSGTIADPITSHIRLLVPIDAIVGLTFTPSAVSVYGFGGFAIGDIKVTIPPFGATQSMAGWSIGVGADVQITPVVSAGVKYRHFDLAKQDFSVFPGEPPSLVRERGDTVTGTLSWHIPMPR
jgi:outer membrane immunogenic protein